MPLEPVHTPADEARTLETMGEPAIDLHDILVEFSASDLGRQLHDPDLARGACKSVSLALLSLLHERGFSDTTLLNLTRRCDQHFVVLIDGNVLDATRRQFDAQAPVPHICSYGEVVSEWTTCNAVRVRDRWDQRVHRLPQRLDDWASMARFAAMELSARAAAAEYGARGTSEQ